MRECNQFLKDELESYLEAMDCRGRLGEVTHKNDEDVLMAAGSLTLVDILTDMKNISAAMAVRAADENDVNLNGKYVNKLKAAFDKVISEIDKGVNSNEHYDYTIY